MARRDCDLCGFHHLAGRPRIIHAGSLSISLTQPGCGRFGAVAALEGRCCDSAEVDLGPAARQRNRQAQRGTGCRQRRSGSAHEANCSRGRGAQVPASSIRAQAAVSCDGTLESPASSVGPGSSGGDFTSGDLVRTAAPTDAASGAKGPMGGRVGLQSTSSAEQEQSAVSAGVHRNRHQRRERSYSRAIPCPIQGFGSPDLARCRFSLRRNGFRQGGTFFLDGSGWHKR